MVDWLQVGQTSGSGDTQILVRAKPNTILSQRTTSLLVSGNTKSVTVPVIQESEDLSQYLTFVCVAEYPLPSNNICWYRDSYASASTIEYSINDGPWTQITATIRSGSGSNPIQVNPGDVIRFRGDNLRYAYEIQNYGVNRSGYFETSGEFYVHGNIMSLISSTSFETLTTLSSDYTFYRLFSKGTSSSDKLDCGGVLLPPTSLTKGCYYGLFSETDTKYSPLLPATSLAESCYAEMFAYCEQLTVAPELPASTMARGCYLYMFNGCTALTEAPVLSAQTLAKECYLGMFGSCSSLSIAPELPASILAESCYALMFADCTSLTKAPDLLAQTLDWYSYQQMFAGCSNLSYIKCLATNPGWDYTQNWVYGVARNGIFVKDGNTSWNTDESGIPYGWTVRNA